MYQEIKFSNTVCIQVLGTNLLAIIIIPKNTAKEARKLVDTFNSLRKSPDVPEYLVSMTGLALAWGLDILGARMFCVSLN